MKRMIKLGLGGALILTAGVVASDETTDDVVAAVGGIGDAGVFSGTTTPTANEFTIRINRPMKVGQKMHVRGEGLNERTVTTVSAGTSKNVEASSVSVSFDAVAHVLAVDPSGRATRVSFDVTTCTMTNAGNPVEIAPAGSVITAVRKGATTIFQLNGKPMGPEATAALDIVASLTVDGTFDDRVLGSDRPRGIGESWAINVDEAVKVLQKSGSTGVSKGDLFGLTTLVDMMDHRGQPCLVLHTQLSTENVIPGFDVPAGMSVKQANTTAMFQGFFPIDESLPPLTDSMRLDMTAVLTGTPDQGSPVELRINGVRIVDLEHTPLPSTTASAVPAEME